ncbi:MAG TPA: ribonuclease HII [Verrucomicrobiota bacterium]|nr:ribonuclease HII [Verrucomicrobiota bacterium]
MGAIYKSDKHKTDISKSVDRFSYEQALKDVYPIAGIDEAGRGPLAGPVIAAAVILPLDWYFKGLPDELIGLNDSKQLSPQKREYFYNILTASSLIKWAYALVESDEIDKINILNATHKAMALAINKLSPQPKHLLIDGNPVKSLTIPQTAIVKGDSLSYSIAAASVIAKVTRDKMMMEYDKIYPNYGFAVHKGYGTKQHLNALQNYGATPIHRKSFAPLNNQQPELF